MTLVHSGYRDLKSRVRSVCVSCCLASDVRCMWLPMRISQNCSHIKSIEFKEIEWNTTSWDVVIINSKTPSHSQAEEFKADPFGVRVDQNNNSSCIGAAIQQQHSMYTWSPWYRRFAYLLCMVWCFKWVNTISLVNNWWDAITHVLEFLISLHFPIMQPE